MKKFLSLIISIFIISFIPCFSNEITEDNLWDNWSSSDGNYNAKPAVSDEEFERAFKEIDSRVNKRKNKAKQKLIPKGTERTQSNETEQIKETAGKKADPPVICVTSEVLISGEVLPIGHYQVKGEIENGTPVLNLYQAQHLMAKIPAIETKDDFGKEELLFAEFTMDDNETVKIIYGSVDFNAYAVLESASGKNLF